jgi:hypothetical protein
MTLVDSAGSAESHHGTVAIILRSARLGLVTATEAGLLIDRVRPPASTPALSTQDNNRAGFAGQAGNLPSGPDRTVR